MSKLINCVLHNNAFLSYKTGRHLLLCNTKSYVSYYVITPFCLTKQPILSDEITIYKLLCMSKLINCVLHNNYFVIRNWETLIIMQYKIIRFVLCYHYISSDETTFHVCLCMMKLMDCVIHNNILQTILP